LAPHCESIVVVTGAHASEIQCPAGACAVVNTRWQSGQLSSLQCGLRALPADVEGVLFTLVDHPDPSERTLALLAQSQALVAVPVHEGRKGHPVWFRAVLIPELLALPADASAKDVFRARAAETEYIAVADPGIADDVDDAAALLRFRARTEFA
jgi:molybdenum cofactor cytidylyltransferase